MHKQPFSVEVVASVVKEKGLEIAYAGRRRVIARMVLAPVLVAYHALRARRLALYDLWDILGSCYAVHAMKPQPCGDSVGHPDSGR
jgi:hypothetical protein